jgi:hypothetical protein
MSKDQSCGNKESCCGSESCCKGSNCGCGQSGCKCGAGCQCGCKSGAACKCQGSCSKDGKCTCGAKSCGCNFAHKLLDAADEAWMCLLKEKIKSEIEKSSGAHLNELAKLVVETNKARWKNKLSRQQNVEQFGEKLKEFFKRPE